MALSRHEPRIATGRGRVLIESETRHGASPDQLSLELLVYQDRADEMRLRAMESFDRAGQ